MTGSNYETTAAVTAISMSMSASQRPFLSRALQSEQSKNYVSKENDNRLSPPRWMLVE